MESVTNFFNEGFGQVGGQVKKVNEQINQTIENKKKLQAAERKFKETKHFQVIACKKYEDLKDEMDSDEHTIDSGGIWGYLGFGKSDLNVLDNAKRKAEEATVKAEEAEKEYRAVIAEVGAVANTEMFTAVKSPLLSASTRAAGSGGLLAKVQNAVLQTDDFPRTLFLTIIGASGLPKMDTIGWCDPYVVITNIATKVKEQTQTIYDNPEPVWEENFMIEVSSESDPIVMEVFDFDRFNQDDYIGACLLPIDGRFICGREVALEIVDKKKKARGVLRYQANWADETEPVCENGKFFYKVIYPHGVRLRDVPDVNAPKGLTLRCGEVFEATQRLKPVDESTTYVRINTSKDKWLRSGWVFEKLKIPDEEGEMEEVPVLERLMAPKNLVGLFFYRVVNNRNGVKLPLRPEQPCFDFTPAYPKGTVLEVTLKVTPLGSDLTFARVDDQRGGYIVEDNHGQILLMVDDNPVLEHCKAPPPAKSKESLQEYAETKYFEVSEESGLFVREYPTLDSARLRFLKQKECFSADGYVNVIYKETDKSTGEEFLIDGGKPVTWLQVNTDPKAGKFGSQKVTAPTEGWIRMTKSGIKMVEELTDIEIPGRGETAGPWVYRVLYEGGILVRGKPDESTPDPQRSILLEFDEKIVVVKKLIYARDVRSDRPVTFLQLEDGGWIFDRRRDDGLLLARELKV